jgi:imidazolonepropionase-like amidohydrolase
MILPAKEPVTNSVGVASGFSRKDACGARMRCTFSGGHILPPKGGSHTYPTKSTALFGLIVLIALANVTAGQAPKSLVLDHVRLIDGTGTAPIDDGRIVISGDRVTAAGPAATTPAPSGSERVDLTGKTVIPGLIDLHFHIENDPRMALRQLANGITSFRDPGQWNEKFVELRRMVAADGLAGPRIFTTGPHIDGENPAYPADSVVARDPEEARRHAETSVAQGATALKIYFRLPLASAKVVVDVCNAHRIPCTAHLEILDARELIGAGLHGIEHITSFGISLVPRVQAEAYKQAVLRNNDARRDGRYRLFADARLDSPEAMALYAVLRQRRPWVDATLAVFERRADKPAEGVTAEMAQVMAAGFGRMKELTHRISREGARVVMGGHTEVPFAGRGEAPWRELELLVDSGFSPLEAITAGTSTAAGFLYRDNDLGSLRAGFHADLVVLRDNPVTSISAVRTVERVMVDGRWVDRSKYLGY